MRRRAAVCLTALMTSLIGSQRHNIDRLLALILLWNVIGGVFVTLGAPWLAEVAGTTGLRSSTVLPTGSGWLAIGVPTHYAGIWLPVSGLYALHRMRRHLRWHWVAIAFYTPQIFAITAPLNVDMRVGLFAMTAVQTAIVVNWIALALFLIHSALALLDTKFGVRLRWVSAFARGYWGAMPLSRTALARRYASIATITALIFLPLVPSEPFYPSPQPFEQEHVVHWRVLLLLPITFVAAHFVAFVWSGGQREPRFSAMRGVFATLVTYVYLAMAAELLSRWLSDGNDLLFRLFILAWIYLQPFMLLLPVIGGVTGAWLGRRVQAAAEADRPWRLTVEMGLALAIPVLAILLLRF